ncbi:uncharacterized protein LOC123884715 [Trifolium pratense]|uniref:uncharacterized protein LOC123884715 n=1 Tax=Trifolium pratense TaxID=57577 RepID=UPI001E697B36|nr:uncharacterized protein LOC123884715 [Trifolium pratense]
MLKWFLHKNVALDLITTKSQSTTPKFNPLLQHLYSSFSFRYCSTTTTTSPSQSQSESESDRHPFPVSYLINDFGFSTQSALKAFNKKQVRFNTLEKPNSVITFFKSHGFSYSKICIIIRKQPWLLSLDPRKRLLPKFKFFLSKGVSSSDIVSLLTENPRILQFGLGKRIIPLFELLSRYLKTNKDVIVCLIRHSSSFSVCPCRRIVANIKLMRDFGVCDSAIERLFQTRPSIFGSNDLIKSLEEVKGSGFDPSMTIFGTALMTIWDYKFDTFKKWGWSNQTVIRVFRFHPDLLSTSIDKINLVMNFWVNQLGWDSLALIKCPHMFGYSLHKRIIPRASVLQYLLTKGLLEKNASLVKPFTYSEKLFLSKFVFRFKESDYLLKLYEDKMKLEYTEEKNNGMPFTK